MTERKRGAIACGFGILLTLTLFGPTVLAQADRSVEIAGNWLVPNENVKIANINVMAGTGCFRCGAGGTVCYSKLNGTLCPGCDWDCGSAVLSSARFELVTDLVIRGRLVDEQGKPAANREVVVTLPTAQQHRAKTDSIGGWTVRLETKSDAVETLDMGEMVLKPDGTPGTDKAEVILVKCPARGICE
jgi:hypothetical protein